MEIDGVAIRRLPKYMDPRGWLIELFRSDEIPVELLPQMAYVSQTEPGVTRGPHEHAHQTDYFAFLGPGTFEMWLWDARPKSPTRGARLKIRAGADYPCAVIVPPGVVHAYRNIGDEPGWVFNAPNRLYGGYRKESPVDEIRHEDLKDSPYQMQ